MTVGEFDWDALSDRENKFMQEVVTDLDGVEWVRPALEGLAARGGIRTENKALLFELRFAHAVQVQGLPTRYEAPGEGESTIDFEVERDGQRWRVELMRLTETKAVREATVEERDENGTVWSSRSLSTDATDKRQSTEGETLKAVERLCQKCERDGRPHKFPKPDDAFNVLLVDCRTFMNGGDKADRCHVALGAAYVPAHFRLSWDGKPITGVFDPATTLKGAKETRERVHFIGFVNEKTFEPGGLAEAVELVANPNLFATEDDVRAAIKTWPLPPPHVLNIKS
ncbi:MAG: hypothetical protein V4597_09005 [Pseudomonadota bacterium]